MKFPGFRVEHYRQLIGGSEYHHARLLSQRPWGWAIAGVLQCDPTDWFVLLTIFRAHAIEVIETHADPPLPADQSANSII